MGTTEDVTSDDVVAGAMAGAEAARNQEHEHMVGSVGGVQAPLAVVHTWVDHLMAAHVHEGRCAGRTESTLRHGKRRHLCSRRRLSL